VMTRPLSKFDQRRIAATLPLRKGVEIGSVLAEVEAATQRFWHDMEKWSESRCKAIELLDERTIKITFNPYKARGAPCKDELRAYITALVTTYERATVEQIGRAVDAYAFGHREKPHAFLVTCLKVAGVAPSRYSFGIVKEVLHGLHPNARRGRPTKRPTP
jgi:hypothetical protein